MKIQQEFTLVRPLAEVWAFFHDVPAVAECLPGAEYGGQTEDGRHKGRMSMKVGPYQASFEGEAQVVYDEALHAVQMEGKGVDKKGASRGKMTMACALTGDGPETRVAIDADVQLSGAIAQFGRTGIIQEIAKVLIADFVRNVEARLPDPAAAAAEGPAPAAPAPAAARPISGLTLLWLSLKGWIAGMFGRKG
jgi:carbon monoxide dehydrogenase subunit G